LGQAEPSVVAALIERLGDEDTDVRGSAAEALGQLGQAEPSVVAALVERLGDEDANVRGSAALALDPEINENVQVPKQAVSTLRGLLEDTREVDYPATKSKEHINNIAWLLLQKYSQNTSQPVYRETAGEGQ
jgi:HEAT repeat protein